jgi:hypothetical protein
MLGLLYSKVRGVVFGCFSADALAQRIQDGK